MSSPCLRIGIAGLGRLGMRHAENLFRNVPRASLVAACSLDGGQLDRAREMGVPGLYGDYGKMLEAGGIDAVFIASTSAAHAAQAESALARGLHVFCEKPTGTSIAECRSVERAVEAARKAHPGLVFQPGFVRRFDPSIAAARASVGRGAIGKPFLVRSQTADMDRYAEFQVAFVPGSGGIFLDMNIHDIDLARWFLSDEVEEVHAVGGSYLHPEFEVLGDADNTVAILKFRKGGIAVLSASRTAFHGHDSHLEIVGTAGNLKVGTVPSRDRTVISDAAGMRVECVEDFYERFREAFLAEAREFVDCALNGRDPVVSARDGTKAAEIGFAMTESFRNKGIVRL